MKPPKTRREFLQATGSGALVWIAGSDGKALASTGAQRENAEAVPPEQMAQKVVAALGDTLIPSDQGDPGYRDLEKYHITAEVMKRLPVAPEQLLAFHRAARDLLGTEFAYLSGASRERFLYQVIKGNGFSDPKLLQTCRDVYELCRTRVFQVFYQNFPENTVPRDANDAPILKPGDTHQITNPNTKQITTGWDVANYGGPMTWEEEERRRERFKKIHWHEDSGDDCPLLK